MNTKRPFFWPAAIAIGVVCMFILGSARADSSKVDLFANWYCITPDAVQALGQTSTQTDFTEQMKARLRARECVVSIPGSAFGVEILDHGKPFAAGETDRVYVVIRVVLLPKAEGEAPVYALTGYHEYQEWKKMNGAAQDLPF